MPSVKEQIMPFRKRIHSSTIIFLAVIGILSFITGARAGTAVSPVGEELNLFQEIPSVSSASKYEQKVIEAPSSVSIITAADIRNFGYRTLADILRSVRSFYVTYDRNYTFVGVRGFGRPQDYNNRVQLLIDGHRTNDNLYDMAAIGTEGILDVDLIDRIEIIRGPGSSLYGSSAFFAVINIITKRGRNLKGAEIAGEAASYDTSKGRVSYGDRYQNGFEAVISGSAYDSKGQNLYFQDFDPAFSSDPRATNNGVSMNTDYDRYQSFFTKMSYDDFTLEAAHVSRTKGISTGVFYTDFNAPDSKTTDKRGYLDLRYEHSLGRQTDVTARIFYDYYEYFGSYSSFVLFGAMNKDYGYAGWWGSEVKLTTRIFNAHRVILGAEYTYSDRLDQVNYDVSPYQPWLNDKRQSHNTGLYFQDEFSLLQKLAVTAGLRYDHYDTFGKTTNPRLALIYTPAEKNAVKFLYGSAFRAPSPFELYYESPTNTANPGLKPERIKTYELVYEQYGGEHFRIALSGFYYRIDGLINQTEASPGITVFRNLERVESRGFEVGLEQKWENGVDGRFSYTVQKTTDVETGEVLSNSPEHLAKLNIVTPLFRDMLFAGLEEQYTGRRKTRDQGTEGSFVITNLTLTARRVAKGLELSASVYNLFDIRYSDPASSDIAQQTVAQDGRNYRLKITYAF
jgi:outer membrane receptor for ferrienterochelin and colicins